MGYRLIQAKPISYGGTRALSSIKYIIIHYTAGNGDTAIAECNYFKNGNTRSAGAHFFVDQFGACYQSIPLNRTAWSAGVFYTSANGAASYWGKCTNANSVSIELCDNLNKDPSAKQIAATKTLVAYIKSQCPNAQTIIRHWDVAGKACPARMIGTNNAKWNSFKAAISGGTVPAQSSSSSSAKKYNTTPKWVGEATVNGLNVRTGPGTNYSKLAAWPQLGKGNLVDVCDSVSGWYYVRIATKHYGWVSASYLKKAGSSSSSPSKPSSSSSSFKVKVTINNLYIRAGAGTNTARRGFIKPGTYTIVETKKGTGSSAGWGRLKSGAGWISLDYAKRV